MRVLIATYPVPKDIRSIMKLFDDDYVIAVDQAVLALYKQRIKIDLAVGDFDSLKNQGILSQLNTVRLTPEKDVTDSHQALVEASKLDPDEMIMVGGIGGNRVEHFVGHLTLFNEFPKLIIQNEDTKIFLVEKGKYQTDFNGYISFFGYPNAVITLKGFKYELDKYELNQYDPLCISNEVKENAQYIVHEGKVLVFLTVCDE